MVKKKILSKICLVDLKFNTSIRLFLLKPISYIAFFSYKLTQIYLDTYMYRHVLMYKYMRM